MDSKNSRFYGQAVRTLVGGCKVGRGITAPCRPRADKRIRLDGQRVGQVLRGDMGPSHGS